MFDSIYNTVKQLAGIHELIYVGVFLLIYIFFKEYIFACLDLVCFIRDYNKVVKPLFVICL